MPKRVMVYRTPEEKDTIRKIWAENLASQNPKTMHQVGRELGIPGSSFMLIINPEYAEKERERVRAMRSKAKNRVEVAPTNGFDLSGFINGLEYLITDYRKLTKERESYKKSVELLQVRTGKLLEDMDNLARRGS